MKKIIALSLCLILALSLCACGGAKEDLTGKWNANINMADAFNAEIAAADPAMAEYMAVESFNLPLVLELKEDGTYTMSVDPAAMESTMTKLAEDMAAGLEAYFTAIFAEQGLEMDVNEALASMGMDLDTLVAELTAELTSEDTFAAFASEGKYKAEKGKLHLTESMDEVINPAIYNTYTLEGDTLTLEVGTEVLEEGMEFLFPMTLTRSK